jgi:hypothetical protein
MLTLEGMMPTQAWSLRIVSANQVSPWVARTARTCNFYLKWTSQRINLFSKRVSLRCYVSAASFKNVSSKREVRFITVTTISLQTNMWIHQNRVTLRALLFALGHRLLNLIWWATITKNNKKVTLFKGEGHIIWRLFQHLNPRTRLASIWNLWNHLWLHQKTPFKI